MKTDSGRGRLYDALQQLRGRWDETILHWNDEVKGEFEKDVWLPLEQLTEETLRAIDQLSQVFLQARQECDDDNILRTIYS